jgi:hypothetical protein
MPLDEIATILAVLELLRISENLVLFAFRKRPLIKILKAKARIYFDYIL